MVGTVTRWPTVRLGRAIRAILLATAVAGLVVQTGIPGAGAAAAAAPSCAQGAAMDVVAHPDDDLLFQSVTIQGDINGGQCVRTVYVTAGDDNQSQSYWRSRQNGVKAAYARMAGVANTWSTSDAGIAGHPMTLATLTADPKISLVFMNLPDGQMNGSGSSNNDYESLQKLYQHAISTIATVDGSSTYTEASLISTLTTLMDDYQPNSINTQDFNGSYGGGDHSDHYTVAYLTLLAQQNYSTPHSVNGYEGYPIAGRPSNLTASQQQAKEDTFFTYAAFDWETCDSLAACSSRPEGSWFSRQYTVGSPQGTPTGPPSSTGTGADLALGATATASSQNGADGQYAASAIDGVIDGYPGDYTKEWATQGGRAGSWLNLAWSSSQTIGRVVLYDRPNLDDQITAATLTFSDGTTVPVPSLANDGSAVTVTFPSRSTSSLRLTVNSVSSSTRNVGLSEIQVYAPDATTPPVTPPTTVPGDNVAVDATATASSQNGADGQYAASAIDGVIDGYPGDYTKEWATQGGKAGSWLNLAWSSSETLDKVVLYDRPNLNDQITAATLTFSDGTTVPVPSLANDGSAVTVTFPSRSTTSLRLTVNSVSSSTLNVGLSEIQTYTPDTTQ